MTIHPLPPVPTQVTAAEQERRQNAVEFGRASVRLEGFPRDAVFELHAARFVAGEIDLAEFRRAILEASGIGLNG